MCTNCAPHKQPGRGVVITTPPTFHYSDQILYAAILWRASHRVHYPELADCLLFECCYCIVCMETAVGACNSVRYVVDVCYWECPLIESPLYIILYSCVLTNRYSCSLHSTSYMPHVILFSGVPTIMPPCTFHRL